MCTFSQSGMSEYNIRVAHCLVVGLAKISFINIIIIIMITIYLVKTVSANSTSKQETTERQCRE